MRWEDMVELLGGWPGPVPGLGSFPDAGLGPHPELAIQPLDGANRSGGAAALGWILSAPRAGGKSRMARDLRGGYTAAHD
jgi:hypothetical protein